MTGPGHNSGSIAGGQLRSFVQRIRRLDAEIKSLNDDKSEIFKEAKGTGFDTKVMRRIIQLRAMEEPDRMERDALEELYRAALGMDVATRAPAREAA